MAVRIHVCRYNYWWLLNNQSIFQWKESHYVHFHDIFLYIVSCSAQSEILQFKEGLGNMVIGIEQFPHLFKPLFTQVGRRQLTRESLKDLTFVTLSTSGSNLRLQEEDTIFSWEVFLQECQGTLSFFKSNQSIQNIIYIHPYHQLPFRLRNLFHVMEATNWPSNCYEAWGYGDSIYCSLVMNLLYHPSQGITFRYLQH